MTYNQDYFRELFKAKFNLKNWYSVLQNFFQASVLKAEPEKINGGDSQEGQGYYLGNIDTQDNYLIGLFYYDIQKGNVAKKRVSLRQLVKSFINASYGEFDAALVVFDSHDLWRLSFICDIKGESTAAKRYTYVFGNSHELYHTASKQICSISANGLSFKSIKEAFSVEKLSDEFFDKYLGYYASFVKYIIGKPTAKESGEHKITKTEFVRVIKDMDSIGKHDELNQFEKVFDNDEKATNDYIKKMMGRITFLHFLQKKGWLCGDPNYMHNLFDKHNKEQDDYLERILEPLFFGVLNTGVYDETHGKNHEQIKEETYQYRKAFWKEHNQQAETNSNLTAWDISLLDEWKEVPYLNGGLFEDDTLDRMRVRFPSEMFRKLFGFFEEYNFTIDENDPNDAVVGVDPEMLGKIFENLLEDNKDKGAFYTPKEIVQYMCQESLIAYLTEKCGKENEVAFRAFVKDPQETEVPHIDGLSEAIKDVKICDPAIGSGAFPMGLLNILYHCHLALGEISSPVEIKRHIIQNNIYGVDIERGAVDIARLRFWLALVVDEDTPEPLPNLDYKIMQGNSLLEQYNGVDLSKLSMSKKEILNKKQSLDFFDDMMDVYRKELRDKITAYYTCFDHTKKRVLLTKIRENIMKQMAEQGLTINLQDINVQANDKFFLWHTWFNDVFNRPNGCNGFDIVIGNPPFVNISNLKPNNYREKLKAKFYSSKNKIDLYAYFIEFSFSIVNSDSIISYIVPETWKATDSFSKLREIIFTKHSLYKVVNLSLGVFEAFVKPMILILKNKSHGDSTIAVFDGLDNFKYYVHVSEILSSNNLSLDTESSKKEKETFKLIENAQKKLGDVISFSRGIKTSNDSRFILKSMLNSDCKKIYRGKNIKAYSKEWGGEYIWYRPDLMKEKVGCLPHSKAFFEVPEKLITQRVNSSMKLLVAFDNEKEYFLDTTNVSNYETWDKKYSLKFICGLMNSKVINFWYSKKYRMPTISGYELDTIPFPEASVKEQEPIISLVEKIIASKKENPQADTSIEESEIDRHVYHLYGFTYDELLIIDPKTYITREQYEHH